MLESTIPLMGDVFLEAAARTRSERGGAPGAAGVPRGIYACRGDDAWIAISACEPSEWEALCKTLDAPGWCRAGDLRTPEGRRRHREQVDRWLAEETARRAPGELFHQLQAAGVPAAPCYTLPEILADPHMQSRGLFRELTVPGGKAQITTGLPWREDGTDWKGVLAPAPALGQHNDYVFREVLGFSQEEYAAYRREGVIE
jgi:benzylsuccinate CoA-transferase BbsF subunit